METLEIAMGERGSLGRPQIQRQTRGTLQACERLTRLQKPARGRVHLRHVEGEGDYAASRTAARHVAARRAAAHGVVVTRTQCALCACHP